MYKTFIVMFLALFANIQASVDIPSLERVIIEMINQERQDEGLSPLVEWNELTLCARKHSQNMADKTVSFGHDGFNDRFQEMHDITFCKKFGENVAFSYNVRDHLETAVRGWMKSPGHRHNILDNFVETGVGIAFSEEGKFYVTQLFAIKDASARKSKKRKRGE